MMTLHFGPISPIFYKTYLIFFLPLLLSPILFANPDHISELKCLYIISIVASFWVLQVLPLPITSFLPLVLFPLFEVISTNELAIAYMSASNFLFVGGLIMAIAAEDSALDKRLALKFIKLFGTGTKGLFIGIMTVTAFLSMLVSNTATTAMMIPILESILNAIDDQREKVMAEKSFSFQNRRNALLLSVAYSASIGGTGLITGGPPNLVLPQTLKNKFGPDASLPFLKWALFAIPIMILNLILAGIWLYIFFRVNADVNHDKELTVGSKTPSSKDLLKSALEKKEEELGPVTFREISIAFLFVILISLWFFKTPRVIPGWSSLFPKVSIASATPTFLIITIAFILPSNPQFWPFQSWYEPPRSSDALITWNVIEKKLPWGLIFLLGGGYALAEATQKSGLSIWIVKSLHESLTILDSWLINFILTMIAVFMTEIVSNTATANIFIPIITDMSLSLCINPIYFGLPVALGCSYAFMMPISTPPNALVYQVSTLKNGDMMKAGIVLNLICIITTSIAANFYMPLLFEINDPPEWLLNVYSQQNITECL